MIVVRPAVIIDSKILWEQAEILIQQTSYQKFAELDDIPGKADCLSAVFHLINSSSGGAINLPLYWIGNAPSRLAERCFFKILETEPLRAGDLVFVKSQKATRLVSHVLLTLSDIEAFHCSSNKGRCELISVQELVSNYQQPFSKDEILNYIDRRSNSYLEATKTNQKE